MSGPVDHPNSGPGDRFAAFRRLHRPGRPLLLPNAWDVASAAVLADAGHPAVGTTSLGVAAAAGKVDATAVTRAETVGLARALGRLSCLVTVDIEAGFSDDPAEVADVAAEVAAAGATGVNLEDGRPDGTLSTPTDHARKIAAIKHRVPRLFVNARTDTFWLPGAAAGTGSVDTESARFDATLTRAAAYVDAGADGLFVPGVTDPDTIGALAAVVDAPLNVLYLPGLHTLPALARLGVARVSTGSALFRAALGATVRAADDIRRGLTWTSEDLPSYAQVQQLAVHAPEAAH
jgi:2-methylisocitrate lyase-like PEP mutase family enzyme